MEVRVTITDNVLCARIVGHLTGQFKPIGDNYDRNYPSITLTDLLKEITLVYTRHVKNGKKLFANENPAPKETGIKIKSYEKPATPKSNHKYKTKGKGKRLFHIQQFDPSYNDLRQLQL